MKMMLTFATLVLAACSHKGAVEHPSAAPKDPPQAEAKALVSDLGKGLTNLKGKKIAALIIFNRPDGYLLRAKDKLNPPDFAAHQVLEAENERVKWLNEAVVTNCDSCADVIAEAPLKVLPEMELLRLIDRVTMHQDPQDEDWAIVTNESPSADFIWLILGSEEFTQKRGFAKHEHKAVTTSSENAVNLKSYVYEVATKKVRSVIEVRGWDQENATFTPAEGKPAKFDGVRDDPAYPYPAIPESPPIVQKALLKLTETLLP